MTCFGVKYGSWLVRSLLLAVYASFFLVQLFCITGPDMAAIISPSASILSFHKAKNNTREAGPESGTIFKTKLSINKRFQHTLSDILLTATADMLPHYSAQSWAIKPKQFPLIALTLTESLRGPPSA